MKSGWRFTIPALQLGVAWLSCGPVYAQSSQAVITGLQSQIAAAEQTLRNEPYLAGFCPQLRDRQHFFHRGRYRQGKPPVVALQAWGDYLKRWVAADPSKRDVAQAQWKEALRRRDEVVNACSLDQLRAEMTKARAAAMPATGTAAAEMTWNDTTDSNRVLTIQGTLTGSFSSWQLTGTGVPSWNGQLRAGVQCTGSISPGFGPKQGSKGTMKCYAEWKDQGKTNTWTCRGNGILGADWSIGAYWFGMYPFKGSDLGCQGTISAGDGKVRSNMFGTVGIKSRLGTQ